MKLPRILIVDDLYGHDLHLRQRFCRFMKIKDVDAPDTGSGGEFFAEAKFCSGQVRSARYVENSLDLVMQEVEKGWPFADGSRWALVMIDYHFSSGPLNRDGQLSASQPEDHQFGKTILTAIAKRWPFKPLFEGERPEAFPEIPCVMFSSHPRGEVEPEVDPKGSRGFMRRFSEWTSAEIDERRREFADILFTHGLVEDGALRIANINNEPQLLTRNRRIVGNSLALLRTLRSARAAIKRSGYHFVLVLGEKGAGKEEIVRYMHDYSGRKGELVPFNISNTPSSLLDTEIFGYQPGSFTGALPKGAPGVFDEAKDGTVFFDEIGNLERAVLEKLLNVTGSGQYRRIGPPSVMNKVSCEVHCQVICATNKPVEQMVRDGLFPGDLLDRFNTIISLPPLAARAGDKRQLFDYFVQQAARQGAWVAKTPVQDVYDLIESYSWPGNVREMKNIANAAVSNRRHSSTIQALDIHIHLEPSSEPHEPVCKNFENLLSEIRMFRFREADRQDARGAYPRFTAAASVLVSTMIETAATLSTSIKPNGSLNFTGCMREMAGEMLDFKSTKAKRLFKKLNDDYNLDKSSPVILSLIDWANKPEYEGGER